MEFQERLDRQVKMEFLEVPACPACLVKFIYTQMYINFLNFRNANQC
jgi:hypothetical protein